MDMKWCICHVLMTLDHDHLKPIMMYSDSILTNFGIVKVYDKDMQINIYINRYFENYLL